MPRIDSRMALLGFKPGTRDKKKRQQEFEYELKNFVPMLPDNPDAEPEYASYDDFMDFTPEDLQ